MLKNKICIVKPLKNYNNSLINKINVLKDNKNKSGIYR
jgi:hypothetical protein